MGDTENNDIIPETVAPGPDERNMAVFCHLSALAGLILPLGNIIGPLIIWLVKKDEMPFVDRHGKEAVNFQISMTIYYIISLILMFAFIGIFLLIGLAIFELVVLIMAAVSASHGEEWQYPLRIPFIQ